MDVISELASQQQIKPEIKSQINASELLTAFNHYKDKIKVLSLDCFDTVLWRKTAQPTDVFYDLQQRPHFLSHEISAALRMSAEAIARFRNYIQHGKFEATLDEIYRAACPTLNEDQIHALVDEEIAAEISACYGFSPIIEIIRAAHVNNIKVIIVSNTYLKQKQLHQLLTSALPKDVMAAINEIFCSCEYGRSKNGGLFEDVLLKLAIPAQSILHIGDNAAADLHAPSAFNINALHLLQFNTKTKEILRLQTIAATLGDPQVRQSRSLASPFRGVYSTAKIDYNKPESVVGYMSMGPIMYAFAHFICEEVKKMEQAGKNVKVLFLLRDGYLPARACEAYMGKTMGKEVRISRFTATAAAFRTKKDVDNYLMESITSLHFRYICHQLLLPENIAAQITESAEKAADSKREFVLLIQQEPILKIIFANSAEYRARLKEYLKNETGLQSGDTLCFVDIGYTGTSQRILTPVLKDEMGVDVTGLYLISLDTPEWRSARRGLLDPSWCDNRTLTNMICSSVALIEEICTGGGDTVVNYDQHGKPMFSKSNNSSSQLVKTRCIQEECVRFVREAKQFFQSSAVTVDHTEMREAALAELIRRIYLPTAAEVEYLQEFQHDLDKGTKVTFQIYDVEKNLNELHRQELPYITFHPYSLKTTSLNHIVTLMAQRRYGFDVALEDTSLRREWLTVLSVNEQKTQKEMLCAVPTHDGYYSLWIPVTHKKTQVAIMLGIQYVAVQIESAELIKSHSILRATEKENCRDIWSLLLFNQLNNRYGKFFECSSNASSVLISPNIQMLDHDEYLIRFVFRPIEKRTG